MGQRDSGLKAYIVDAICGVTPTRNGIANPDGSAIVRGHFCEVGLTPQKVSQDAARELKEGGARWVKVLKVTRDHETEIASERLLDEMLAAMRGA